MKKKFITELNLLSDWLEEYTVPVLVAEKHDLEKSKLMCSKILDELKCGASEFFVLKKYTVIDEEDYFKIKDLDFTILISNKSLNKYKLKYLLELAIDFLEKEMQRDNELIKIKIEPK